MKELTPLLADSLKDCLITIYKSHNSQIAKDLLDAQDLIETYNVTFRQSYGLDQYQLELLKGVFDSKISLLITDEVRALSIRKDVFEIAFTPKGKDLIYSNESQRTWSREGRQTGKPGRIIKKLLAKDYKERDIELFSNQLKAEIMNFGDFQIVSGEDICYWYRSENYYKIAGTLGNSCMRYDECQCYFEVYKDLAKMLICVKDNLLLGRAIVWEIDGITYMDRVYVCLDYLEEQFYQYAMEKGWTIRENNSLLYDENSQRWLEASDNYKVPKTLDITLTCVYKYPRFPYMDSFRYFDPDTLTLYCTYPDTCVIHLSNTDGHYNEGDEYECPCCGERITVYEDEGHPWYWSELCDMYICPDCALYNEWADDYIHSGMSITEVWDGPRRIDVPTLCVEENWTNATTESCDDFVKIDGKFYTQESVIWDEETQRYIVDND